MPESSPIAQFTAVAQGAPLSAGTVIRAIVGGADLAIWRGSDAIVRAWENRCPHRGMRLSYGFVRETKLLCIYHGWGFAGDGSCASIPAHPNITPPKTIKVRKYQCVERGGLIFVAEEGAPAMPDLEANWRSGRTVFADTDLQTARERLSTLAACAYPDCGNLYTLEAEGDTYLLALQDAGPGLVGLHLARADGSDKRRCDKLARRLRHEFETQQFHTETEERFRRAG